MLSHQSRGAAEQCLDEGVWWSDSIGTRLMRCRRVPITRHQLSGGVGGLGGCPREVTSKSEHFVTVLSTAHLQQASVVLQR